MEKLKKSTKDMMGLGITGMAGLGAMGAMSNLPGMPKEASIVPKMGGVGINLAMTGGVLKIAKDMYSIDKTKSKKQQGGKKNGNKKY